MRLALLASTRNRFQYVFLAILIEVLNDSGISDTLVRQIYGRVLARIDNSDEKDWVVVPSPPPKPKKKPSHE